MCIYAHVEFKNVEEEYDIGFTGENGGVSKYDLFIEDYFNGKTLFEFQSRFHDGKEGFDLKKFNFAKKAGYNIIQLDCRRITPQSALSKYFNLNVSSEEIANHLKFSATKDYQWVQELLLKNISVKKISEITGVPEHCIHHKMRDGTLSKAKDRKFVLYGKTPIVQLDLEGNFIKRFDSSYAAFKELGYRVDSCVAGLTRHAHCFIFIKELDYISKNYKIPDKIRVFNEN